MLDYPLSGKSKEGSFPQKYGVSSVFCINIVVVDTLLFVVMQLLGWDM